MANLIFVIDPYCELYVAKVVKGRNGILPDNVAEAIDLVRSKDVDIISMSFSIPDYVDTLEYTKRLKEAVRKASEQNDIIQFCSHHDEGWNVSKSWPAECPQTQVVVACNEFGSFPEDHVGKHDYKIHGMDISAGAVPYLESTESISGSPVATAIVAGLASLMLSCRRLEFPAEMFDNKSKSYSSKRNFVKDMLEKISESAPNEARYVRLANFSGFLRDGDGKNSKVVYPWLDPDYHYSQIYICSQLF